MCKWGNSSAACRCDNKNAPAMDLSPQRINRRDAKFARVLGTRATLSSTRTGETSLAARAPDRYLFCDTQNILGGLGGQFSSDAPGAGPAE